MIKISCSFEFSIKTFYNLVPSMTEYFKTKLIVLFQQMHIIDMTYISTTMFQCYIFAILVFS